MLNRLLAALILIAVIPNQVWAWGSEGHRVVAEIADQCLGPVVAAQVRELLAIENNTDFGKRIDVGRPN